MHQGILVSLVILVLGIMPQKALSDDIDSMLVLTQKQLPDTQQIDNHITLSIKLSRTDISQGLIYARRAESFISNSTPALHKAKVYENLVYLFSKENKLDSALLYSQKAMSLVDSITDIEFIGMLYASSSICYRQLNDYFTAIDYAKKAFSAYAQLMDTSSMMTSLRLMGLAHDYAGNSDSAIFYGFKALNLVLDKEVSKEKALCAINIASAYSRQNRYEKALEYMQLGKEALPKKELPKYKFTFYNNMGVYYKNLSKYDSAVKNYHLALEAAIEQNDTYETAIVSVNIADILAISGKYAQAKKYATDAVKLCLKKNYPRVLISAYQAQGEIYSKEGSLGQARLAFEKAYKLSVSKHFINETKDLSRNLTDVYAKQGDFEKAYHMQVIYKEISDSLMNKEKIAEITRIELQHTFQQERSQINALNKQQMLEKEAEISRQKYFRKIFIISGLFMLIAAFGGFVLYRTLQKRKAEKLQGDLFLYMQRTLSQQMTPHFFFNALTTIQSYILTKEQKHSINYISKFAALMRKTLENSQNHTVTLNEEFDFLKLYVGLEQENMNHRFDYKVSYKDGIEPQKLKIPSFIVQPIIENAIKHGIAPLETKGLILVNIYLGDGELLIEVNDNGIGLKKAGENKLKEHKSMATNITQKRLMLLNEYYHGEYSIKYTDRKTPQGEISGTSVTLTLPRIE